MAARYYANIHIHEILIISPCVPSYVADDTAILQLTLVITDRLHLLL